MRVGFYNLNITGRRNLAYKIGEKKPQVDANNELSFCHKEKKNQSTVHNFILSTATNFHK